MPDYYEDIDTKNYNIERDPTKELFLVGLLNKKNIGIQEPHDTDCNAHNLHAWKTCKTLEYYNQTNFKKLFFHKIFVQELHPKKDVILLDSLFVPGVDYVIQNEPFNATIMENGHNKSKLLTKNNILLIYKTIMQKYINIMRDCPMKNIANIRLGSLLGSGYQGAVFADLNDETRVIKNMKLVRGNTSAFYEFMFAGIIAGIDKKTHHFLKFYDGFLYKNNIYLYLEKADWSLCSHNFSLRDWHKIYTNVRESMEFLHNANILHGDIQPKNIMYSKARDKFVIIDFGLMSWMPAEGPRIDYEMFADIPNRAKIGKILKQYSLDFLLSHVSDANMQVLHEKMTNKNINVNAEIEKFAGFNYIKKYDVFKNDPENILFAKNIAL
jgi:serine/threonine protein kinase